MSAEQSTRATSRIQRIGFISTRIAGTDGVSLETEKWATVLERLGYECYHIAGELEKSGAQAHRIDEAAFTHPTIVEIQKQCFGVESRPRELSKAIDASLVRIKEELYRCQDKLKLDLWIAENCLALPMNIPLGLALTEFLAETGLPCLAHHHDFTWERERFATSAVSDYLHAAFPPKLPSVHHVVINSVAQSQLSYRLGVAATLIPNVMDFANPPPAPDEFARGFRHDIGLSDDRWLILQPTRVVPRKKIELAIELVRRLEDPRARLVVTHSIGDEGEAYPKHIRNFARLLDVPVLFTHEWVRDRRHPHEPSVGHKQYAIRDTYPHADLVTYPSEYEGFGNAFLEAIYFRKPIVCNRYSIYRTDIEPKGFDVVALPGFVTEESVEKTRAILRDAHHCREMVERNYALGEQFFSYAVLERKLEALLTEIAGVLPQSR
jgi:glycosyltransferase involved in cell wall biosynthesis